MAKKRETIQEWEGVQFQNFPLKLEKRGKNTDVYVFGGRYFSVTTTSWAGVDYTGRYRFHVPSGIDPDEICNLTWTVKQMREQVSVINGKGEWLDLERDYFTLYPQNNTINHYAAFIGGHYKTTLAGIGRNRDYEENIINGHNVEILARTSNRCRSGRYGSYAIFALSASPIEIEGIGVR